MEIKYSEGLEFECDGEQQADELLLPQESGSTQPLVAEKEEALRQILRHGFRVPVGQSQQMFMTFAGDSYVVFNLSANGVGVYLNRAGQFEVETRLQGASLSIAGQSFAVDGTVVHLSNDGAHYLCGIELTDMTPACQAAVHDYLQKSKSALFTS
ncbi:MAG: PilZ domain-containing protein [Desulfobulbaceae bacterium]|nr:PilZ domain-containing protein [Desulfobulbaceae bacterium]